MVELSEFFLKVQMNFFLVIIAVLIVSTTASFEDDVEWIRDQADIVLHPIIQELSYAAINSNIRTTTRFDDFMTNIVTEKDKFARRVEGVESEFVKQTVARFTKIIEMLPDSLNISSSNIHFEQFYRKFFVDRVTRRYNIWANLVATNRIPMTCVRVEKVNYEAELQNVAEVFESIITVTESHLVNFLGDLEKMFQRATEHATRQLDENCGTDMTCVENYVRKLAET